MYCQALNLQWMSLLNNNLIDYRAPLMSWKHNHQISATLLNILLRTMLTQLPICLRNRNGCLRLTGRLWKIPVPYRNFAAGKKLKKLK